MIDTDKYEGHTPAPWKAGGYDVQAIKVWTVDGLDETQNWIQVPMADRLLTVDAPLLLAEIKRLRDGYKKIALDYDFNAIISQGRSRMKPSLDVDTKHGVKVTYHQKACLRMMELFEDD